MANLTAPPRRRQPSATSASATSANAMSSPLFYPFNSGGNNAPSTNTSTNTNNGSLAESNSSKNTSDYFANSGLKNNAFLRNSESPANNNIEVNGSSMKDNVSDINSNSSSNNNSSNSNSHSQMRDLPGVSAHHPNYDSEKKINNSAFIKSSGPRKSESLSSNSDTNVEPRNPHANNAKKQVPETSKGSFFESFLLLLNVVLAICIIATLVIAIYTTFVVSEHWKRNIKTYTGDINMVGGGQQSGMAHDEM